MRHFGKLALTSMVLVFAAPHAQAASFETAGKTTAPAPLITPLVTSKSLAGKAEQRRGGYRMRGGGGRGYRAGGRHFGSRNVYRGHRGYRENRYRRHRGRNFGLGLAAGVFLGSALSYPRYSSYSYPTYGYPNYGYPSYGYYGGYERCRYRGRYYDASFCYNFPYGYRREYRGGYEGGHRHYHGRHCGHDRRHHGYYREY